jgi:hypothetical protein
LAVPADPAETVWDSQEWLSYVFLRRLDNVPNAFKLIESQNIYARVLDWRQAEMRQNRPSSTLIGRSERVRLL